MILTKATNYVLTFLVAAFVTYLMTMLFLAGSGLQFEVFLSQYYNYEEYTLLSIWGYSVPVLIVVLVILAICLPIYFRTLTNFYFQYILIAIAGFLFAQFLYALVFNGYV